MRREMTEPNAFTKNHNKFCQTWGKRRNKSNKLISDTLWMFLIKDSSNSNSSRNSHLLQFDH